MSSHRSISERHQKEVPIPVTASTGDVRLRDVTVEDLPVFFEHQRDPVANEMAAFPARIGRRSWSIGRRTCSVTTPPGGGRSCWTARSSGTSCAGRILGDTLVGYWIGREHWGKGIATRALTLLLAEVDTRPLHAHVVMHNAGSIRVLEKCGFRIVGEQTFEESGERIVEVILRLDAEPESAAT